MNGTKGSKSDMQATRIARRFKARPKANWTRVSGQVMEPKKKPVRRIRKRSKAMDARMRQYRKLANAFKRDNPKCAMPKCQSKTDDVHHTRGRAGSLLLDWRYWKPVCRSCHDWIQRNPIFARDLKMLCDPGLWNEPDRTEVPEYIGAKGTV